MYLVHVELSAAEIHFGKLFSQNRLVNFERKVLKRPEFKTFIS